jgi:ubiquitin-protein ligase E3 C
MDYDYSFDGPTKKRHVNLSTGTTASSSTLLSTVRAQRIAREEARRQNHAASRIQKIWRKHATGIQAKEDLLHVLESGEVVGVEGRARALIILFRGGLKDAKQATRAAKLLEGWCASGLETLSKSH